MCSHLHTHTLFLTQFLYSRITIICAKDMCAQPNRFQWLSDKWKMAKKRNVIEFNKLSCSFTLWIYDVCSHMIDYCVDSIKMQIIFVHRNCSESMNKTHEHTENMRKIKSRQYIYKYIEDIADDTCNLSCIHA